MSRSDTRSKRIALSAIMVALMTVLLYISSLFPVMSLSIIAIAGVISAVLVAECGIAAALLAYAATSVLSLLLVPDKSNAVLYLLLFGIYPIIQALTDGVKRKWFTWILKLLAANVLFCITWFVFKNLFFSSVEEFAGALWLLCAVYNVLFVMYDMCLKKLVVFYQIRISKLIR